MGVLFQRKVSNGKFVKMLAKGLEEVSDGDKEILFCLRISVCVAQFFCFDWKSYTETEPPSCDKMCSA